MQYRDVNTLGDFSQSVAMVIDFIGESEYRQMLGGLAESLNMKGGVTPYDDTAFSLELELLNIEIMRAGNRGNFVFLPEQCHNAVDFLLGLGQTIQVLSESAKSRLIGRIRKGFAEGLWPLQHELRVAGNLSKGGYDLYFHDLEEDGGFDFLAARDGLAFEVEAKAVSIYTGWPIKPENADKLLVEIKNHFTAGDNHGIPILGLVLRGNLLPQREALRALVDAFCEVVRTRQTLCIDDASIRFIGSVPDMDPMRPSLAAQAHAKVRKTMVLVNPVGNRMVLELESKKPISLEKKIQRTLNDAARSQFTGTRPGVIWTHIAFSDDEQFARLSTTKNGKACIFDGVSFRALTSKGRDHLVQLVFTGGWSFMQQDQSTSCSSYSVAVYNSPASRFGNVVLFPDGRTTTNSVSGQVPPVPRS